jgi:GNAT superfamily N-acetyltransferase
LPKEYSKAGIRAILWAALEEEPMKIRNYQPEDEKGWVRCRMLSFLNTAYFDNVLREKEQYDNPAIELVAEVDGMIAGLLDLEYEQVERTVCSRGRGLGGMIWHIAVHPDFQRMGVGAALLKEAERLAKKKGLNRMEAWTRDDRWVRNWYDKNGFVLKDSYLHVYIDGDEELKVSGTLKHLYPVQTFAHYTGDDAAVIKNKFKRVHECVCYEKAL